MQEEFEKKLQQRMHAFGIQPAPQVWDDIEAVLSKKKRRVFIGWWLLLGLMAGIGLFFLVTKNTGNNTTAKNNIQQPAAKNATQQTPVTAITPANRTQTKTAIAKQQNKVQTQNTQPNTTNATTITTPFSSIPNKNGVAAFKPGNSTKQGNSSIAITQGHVSENKTSTTPSANTLPPSPTTQANNPVIQPQSGEVPKAPEATNPANGTVVNNAGTTTNQPIPLIEQKNTPAVAKTSTEKPNKPATLKLIASHHHQWFVNLSSGVLQTPNKGMFVSPDYGYISNYYMPLQAVLPLSSLAAFKQAIDKPSAGWYVSAGGSYQYSLSNRWQLHGGVQLMYLSNTQKAGNSSSTPITSPTTVYTLSGAQYYLPGQQSTAINKAWQLQIPVGISYVFNPKAKTKFMLDGGLSYAWQYSSLWLIPDTHYDRLYYNKSSLNNSIYNWQFGPSVQFHNQLQLGLQFQRSFNSISKNYITPQLYWQRIGLQASIPLTFTKKEKHANK